mgnify:FL=1
MAFEIGNTLGSNPATWRNAIKAITSQKMSRLDKRTKLEAVAAKLVEMALEGDIAAIKEIGQRLDGMAHQSVSLDANSLDRSIAVNLSFVKPANIIENQVDTLSLSHQSVSDAVIVEPVIEPVMVEQINQDEPLTER